MTWGRKKSQGLPQHIFSISWLPKLKQRTTEKPKCQSANAMQKSRRKSPQSPSSPVCFRWAQHTQGSHSFHDGSVPRHPALRENLDRTDSEVSHFEFPEDGFLQFCFRKQSHECEEGKEPHEFLCFSSDSSRSNCNFTGSEPSCRMLGSQKVSGIPSDIRTTKSKKTEDQTETEFKRLPTIAMKEWKLRKAEKRNLEDAEKRMSYWKELKEEQKISGPTLGKAADLDSKKFYHMNEIKSLNSRKSSQRGLVDKPGISSNSIQGFADSQMIKALMLKGEKQRSRVTKSHRGNGETQQRKSRRMSNNRTLSPRTLSRIEICKIRALENLKAAREKRHAKLMRAFERLAVVKCSFDPQEDFRESMMEMIIENRIQKPEALETLLACFLSLNSEEYHDIIVKVFRQVWFDLNACICELQTGD